MSDKWYQRAMQKAPYEDSAKTIGEMIEKIRLARDIDRPTLGEYLHGFWKLASSSAQQYINYLEGGGVVLRLFYADYGRTAPDGPNLGRHEQRISDVFAALAIQNQETAELIELIQRIQPKFRLVHSDVAALVNR